MQTTTPDLQVVAFDGDRLIGAGEFSSLLPLLKKATEHGAPGTVLVFDATTSQRIEIDLRDSDDAAGRHRSQTANGSPDLGGATDGATTSAPTAQSPRRPGRPGRPKLGVVAREVTLLPRHWDWLAAQPGGASAALRRLVDQARTANAGRDRTRRAQEYAYRFLSATLGDHLGFEEATRALFGGDRERFIEQSESWPADLRDHARRLADAAFPA